MTEMVFFDHQIHSCLKKAKNFFVDAIGAAKNGNLEASEILMEQGSANLANGEQIINIFAQKDICQGEKACNLLLLQAQESLVSTENFKKSIVELIDTYRWIN